MHVHNHTRDRIHMYMNECLHHCRHEYNLHLDGAVSPKMLLRVVSNHYGR